MNKMNYTSLKSGKKSLQIKKRVFTFFFKEKQEILG